MELIKTAMVKMRLQYQRADGDGYDSVGSVEMIAMIMMLP